MSKLRQNQNGIKFFCGLRSKSFQRNRRERFPSARDIKEAEAIEKELEKMPDLEDCEFSEEKFQALLLETRRRGLLQETEDFSDNISDSKKNTKENVNDKRNIYARENNQKQRNTNFRRGVIKGVAAAAAVVFAVFGSAMTSQANKAYLMQEVNNLFGNDVNTEVDNDKALESDRTEKYASEDIENTIGVKMPKFFYLPEKMRYEECTVDKDAQIGIMRFSYEDRMIYFMVLTNEQRISTLSQNDKGVEIKQIINELTPQLNITLWEIKEEDDEQSTYALRWSYRNFYYEFFGKLPMEEIETIGENIMY